MKQILLFGIFFISVLAIEAQLVQVVTEVFDPSLLPGADEYAAFAEENNLTTYRIYAETVSPTDLVFRMRSFPVGCLCQNSIQHSMPCAPIYFNTTTSFYNSSDFGAATGNLIFPALYPSVPEMAGDSWLTIGKENHNDPGQLNIHPFLESASAFTEEEGENFYSIGEELISHSSIYFDPIYPIGPNNRTLLGQITTDGDLWFALVLRVFEELGSVHTYTPFDCMPISTVGGFVYAPDIGLMYPPNQGCTDEAACNYDPEALYDNNSCLYIGDYCNDHNPDTFDTTLDENCDCVGGNMIIFGCLFEEACNYDPNANAAASCTLIGDPCDDGNPGTINDALNDDCECEGEGIEIILGCTDSNACNYTADAQTDDGSCEFPGDPCDDGDPDTFDDVLTEACDCEGTVNVDERFMASVTVFPNPANDVLTIDLGDLNDLTQLTIYDLNGRMVVSEQMIGRSTINVSEWSSGRYWISLEWDGARVGQNLMISH